MDRQLEDYYNNFYEMFRTEGWKQLMEEVGNNAEIANDIETTKDQQDLYFRKGQLAVFRSLTTLEEVIQASEEQAKLSEELPTEGEL